MRQITQHIYKFDELSDKVKRKVLDRFRDKVDVTYICDEVGDTRDAFEGMIKGLEPKDSMKGLRLRTYILNNFYNAIFKPKYYSVNFSRNVPIEHSRIKYKSYGLDNPKKKKGKAKCYWFYYYSGCQVEYSCPLTGVTWDFDVLQPIMDLITYKAEQRKELNDLNWDTLIRKCLESLSNAEDSEIEYQHSDDAVTEFIKSMDYEFYENGDVYGHE